MDVQTVKLKTQLKYAIVFAVSFAVLTAVGFLAGLFLNIEFAPAPVAQALADLINFTPVMAIAALILGFAQTFLSLWLRTHHHPKWFWVVNVILALILGGAGSFFALWLVWALIALSNLLLNFLMTRFLELRQLKHAKS